MADSANCLPTASASAISEPATSLSVSESAQTMVSTLTSEQGVGSNNLTSSALSVLSDAAQSAPSPSSVRASLPTPIAPDNTLGTTTTQTVESSGMCMILIEANVGVSSAETAAFAPDQMRGVCPSCLTASVIAQTLCSLSFRNT